MHSNACSFRSKGVAGTATAGGVTNIDLQLTDDVVMTGGTMITKGAAFGDKATLQVVDIDGIYAPAGTILGQYVTDWQMKEVEELQADLSVPYPANLPNGTYLRCVYTSTGGANVKVGINYILHKVLI
jgi:hypothetical protein